MRWSKQGRNWIMATAVLALIAALSAWNVNRAQAEVASGEAAPNFTLTDTHGKTHSLSDFKDKIVVLEWINHGCPFVVKHYNSGNMQSLQTKYTGQGVVWLSICSSADGKQGHMSASAWNDTNAKLKAAPTAVLLDADGKVGKLYGAKTTPHMYIIGKDGKLLYQGAIDSKRSADANDIKTSENYVASVLDAVLAGKEAPLSQSKPYGCSVKYAN